MRTTVTMAALSLCLTVPACGQATTGVRAVSTEQGSSTAAPSTPSLHRETPEQLRATTKPDTTPDPRPGLEPHRLPPRGSWSGVYSCLRQPNPFEVDGWPTQPAPHRADGESDGAGTDSGSRPHTWSGSVGPDRVVCLAGDGLRVFRAPGGPPTGPHVE